MTKNDIGKFSKGDWEEFMCLSPNPQGGLLDLMDELRTIGAICKTV
ncbi:hypothetical protein AGMMS49965_09800 [Bacteroidia bacterium]|nr:hypothetical protein AGMMS49965_09800 [Bacteroidia bacterium]